MMIRSRLASVLLAGLFLLHLAMAGSSSAMDMGERSGSGHMAGMEMAAPMGEMTSHPAVAHPSPDEPPCPEQDPCHTPGEQGECPRAACVSGVATPAQLELPAEAAPHEALTPGLLRAPPTRTVSPESPPPQA